MLLNDGIDDDNVVFEPKEACCVSPVIVVGIPNGIPPVMVPDPSVMAPIVFDVIGVFTNVGLAIGEGTTGWTKACVCCSSFFALPKP